MNAEPTRRSPPTPAAIAQVGRSDLTPARKVVEELYLLIYNRLPDSEELGVRRLASSKGHRRATPAVEDLMWALINSPEFVFED